MISTSVPPSAIRLSPRMRRITTTGGAAKVRGANNQPVANRDIILLGKDSFGRFALIATTKTDANGDYTFLVNCGVHDTFIVVGVGSKFFAERTVAIGDLLPVP